jgi:peptidoglycan/xylan/chitin deacetylase (PgdA/CDA1 family)
MLWTEELIYRLNHTKQPALTVVIRDQEQRYDINTVDKKEKAANHIRQQLKHSLKKEVEEVLEQIRTQLQDVSLELTSEKDQLRYRFMDWHHLREMAGNGMEIGSHTHNHVLLSQLDETECRNELQTSRDLIESHLRIPCILFSYPNGKRSDFSRRDIDILQELGYRCATTQEVGWNNANTGLFELHRLNISRKMTGIAFETSLALPFQQLRRKR